MERIKFDHAEIVHSAADGTAPDINYPVTPAENMLALFEGKNPVWFPMTTDSMSLCTRIDPDNISRAFVIDGGIPYDRSLYGGPDMFGIEWEFVPVAGGSMVKPGKPALEDANDWKEVIKFPNVAEWDWEGAAKDNEAYLTTNKLAGIMMLNGFMYERLISFMDFEGAAIAIIDEDQKDAVKELIGEMLDKVYIPYLENAKKYFPQLQMVCLHDDWGSQRAPFFSLETAREMFVPFMQKFAAKCKELGLIFQLHSCGANELVVPAYIEGGVQMWNGMSGINDKKKYHELWGKEMVFGVDPPAIASDMEADKDDLLAAAKEFCETYIVDGKCHAIANLMRVNPMFIEFVYKISREMLNA